MIVIGLHWVTWVVTINVMKLFEIIKEVKIVEKMVDKHKKLCYNLLNKR